MRETRSTSPGSGGLAMYFWPSHWSSAGCPTCVCQAVYRFAETVKRPKKLLQPFVLVIQDCLLRARSLASVNPIVRFTRGGFAEVVSASFTLASVFSFLAAIASAAAAASSFCFVRKPNSVSLRLFFIGSPLY